MENKENMSSHHVPLLSIVIPAYNVENFILPAVKSALNQSYPSLEVIVVDDGSTDGTVGKIAKIKDDRLQITQQENKGLAGARNTGIRLSRGKYIGFLDGDDIWFQNRAASLIDVLESDPTIGIAFSNLIYIDEQGNANGQLLVSSKKQPKLNDLIIRNHINCPIVRRKCFESGGVFNETLKACEDYEMWVRLLFSTKYKCQLVDHPTYGYRIRKGSLTTDYSAFIKNAHKVMEIFDSYIPHFSTKFKSRALGENYRIISRKALSDGKLDQAESFINLALHHCPSLIFRDLRALGTFGLIKIQNYMPKQFRYLPYKTARRLLKIFYKLYGLSLNKFVTGK